jgi:hypothetical protein
VARSLRSYAALMALRIAKLRVLAATTAVVWGRSQSAPPERILAEASARTQGYLASLDRRSATERRRRLARG